MSLDVKLTRQLNQIAKYSPATRIGVRVLATWLAYVLLGVAAFLSTYGEILLYQYAASVFIPALLARFVVVEGIYLFFKRPRPSDDDGITPLFINTNPSFPSGHATFFFALATTICVLGLPGAYVYLGATALMCFARVSAGVHYPSDILAGMLIGVGTTSLFVVMFGL